MTEATHDTFVDLKAGTPRLFIWSARSLPFILLAQFLLAGQALFGGATWDVHMSVGGIAAVPVLIVIGYALLIKRLRGFAWWACILAMLYVLQVALAANGDGWLQFHPLNAALMLTASLVFAFKVERRSAASKLV